MGIQVQKLRHIISQANDQKIVLPNFQREFTYSRAQQKELLLSLFCGIPVGTILTLNAPGSSFEYRNIGRKSNIQVNRSGDDKTFLLDGQQRMSTFWNALTDIYKNLDEKSSNELYGNIHNYLRSRWFIKLKKDENFSDDIWGFRTLGVGLDLQHNLLPDDLSQFIEYDNAIKKESLNWPGSLNYPMLAAESSTSEVAYRNYLNERWALPLHIISDSDAFNTAVSMIATARTVELMQMFTTWKFNSTPYSSLTNDQKELCEEITGANDEVAFGQLEIGSIQSVLMTRQSSWMNRFTTFCQRVLDTEIGVIQLERDALNKGHVIFDVINRSGVKLTSFDLFCASKPGLDVRSKVNNKVLDLAGMKDKKTDLVSDRYSNQLLNLLRVVHGHRNNEFSSSVLKSDKIFSISSDELKAFLEDSIAALNKAYELVHERCGVPSIEKIPYELRILPVAFSIYLGVDGHNGSRAIYLYWLTFFGGRYRESQNSRCYGDLKAIRGLFQGHELPDEYGLNGGLWNSILNVPEYNDLQSLIPHGEDYESRTSVKEGLLQWVLSKNPRDFPPKTSDVISTQTEKLEAHHILPLNGVTTIGESTQQLRNDPGHYLNSPLNLTYISSESNRAIGGMDFQRYSEKFTPVMKAGHCIPLSPTPDAAEAWNKEWLSRRFHLIQQDINSRLSILHNSF